MGKPKKGGRKRPPNHDMAPEHRFALAIRRADLIERIVVNLTWALAVVGGVYFAIYLPIKVTAGKTATIQYLVSWLADFNVHVALAWSTAAACLWWGWRERKKRLQERAERDERIKQLETHLDPNRTSSNLTVDGHAVQREAEK